MVQEMTVEHFHFMEKHVMEAMLNLTVHVKKDLNLIIMDVVKFVS